MTLCLLTLAFVVVLLVLNHHWYTRKQNRKRISKALSVHLKAAERDLFDSNRDWC